MANGGKGNSSSGGGGKKGFAKQEEDRSSNPSCALDLLKVTMSLLTVLLPSSEQSPSYAREYTDALRSGDGVKSILSHLQAASAFAASSTLKGSDDDAKSLQNNEGISVTSLILSLLFSASSSSQQITAHLTEQGLHRSLCTNELLRRANEKWSRLTKENWHKRGYNMIVETGEGGGVTAGYDYLDSSPVYKRVAMVDPVHGIWLLAIKTCSSMLSMGGGGFEGQGGDFVGSVGVTSDTAVDFLCTYGGAFLSCLQVGPYNGARYTELGLKEQACIFELLSVVCNNSSTLRRFKHVAGDLSVSLLDRCSIVARDLCSFLGSSVVAREILRVGHAPLFGPSARHDAVSHAHHASSSIVAMTKEDKEGLGSGGAGRSRGGPGALGGKAVNIGNFDNSFGRKIEALAATCLLHAIETITRSHPAASSFVKFSVEESKNLNLGSVARIGANVGVRCGLGVGGERGGGERFGEIVGIGGVGGSMIDVCYFDDSHLPEKEIERGVTAFRISGIQDVRLRKPVLDCSTGGSGAKEISESALCVGHLGLGLKWCKAQGWQRLQQQGRRDGRSEELKIMAERLACLLCCELSLNAERQINDGKSTAEVAGGDDVSTMVYDIFEGGREGHGGAAIWQQLFDQRTLAFLLDSLGDYLRAGRNVIKRGEALSGSRGRSSSSGGVWGR